MSERDGGMICGDSWTGRCGRGFGGWILNVILEGILCLLDLCC